LDYEVVAWAESGTTYSITQGSIGTFIPKEGRIKEDREHWTYNHGKANSVWPELNKILATPWQLDTGRRMKITLAGLDCGYHSKLAYAFLDSTNHPVVGLKGKDLDKATRFAADLPPYKVARERKNMYLVEVNRMKDLLSELMKLKWDPRNDETQPPDFMNYPTPSGGKYLFDNYFKHFEAEHRVAEHKNGMPVAVIWKKKRSSLQNHFWDVRVYTLVLRDIFIMMFAQAIKEKNFTWSDYCRIITEKK
jgi:phage terminase large subunit GpA-like protein